MKQNEEKVDLDTQEVIKRYKREVANLHRALNRLQKDKEQLLAENIRLIEKLSQFEEIFD